MAPKRQHRFVKFVGAASLGSTVGAIGAAAPASSVGGAADSLASNSGTVSQAQAMDEGMLSLSVSTDAQGATHYDYHTGSGTDFSLTTPPSGFDPLTATDGQLSQYGFPLRPTTPGALSAWTQAMAAWRSAPVPRVDLLTKPISVPQDSGNFGTDSAQSIVSNGEDANWSGWDVNSSSQSWYAAGMSWVVPDIYTGCGPDSIYSIWTGLGGVNSGQFLQSGLAFNENIPNEATFWSPFWQTFSGGSSVGTQPLYGANDTSLAVYTDDVVYSKTSYDPSNQTATFFFENESSGQSAEFQKTDASAYFDGSTAEWIGEFPEPPGADYSPYLIQNAYALSLYDVWTPIAKASNSRISEVFNNVTYQHPGTLGSDGASFANFFDACLPPPL